MSGDKRKPVTNDHGSLTPYKEGRGWWATPAHIRPEHAQASRNPRQCPPKALLDTKAQGLAWLEGYAAGCVEWIPHPSGDGGQWGVPKAPSIRIRTRTHGFNSGTVGQAYFGRALALETRPFAFGNSESARREAARLAKLPAEQARAEAAWVRFAVLDTPEFVAAQPECTA